MMVDIEGLMARKAQSFNQKYEEFIQRSLLPQGCPPLPIESAVKYTMSNGGKRFRPVLALLSGEAFGAQFDRIFPLALAIEMIHSYSLIHDDLPCMDDDDVRRGKPTNHKVFGEATALLAGDALQAEAFGILLESYSENAWLGIELMKLLAEACGMRGMVVGQAMDMDLESKAKQGKLIPNIEVVEKLHRLKTGALIRVCTEGAGIIAGVTATQRQTLRRAGENLGLAFQVADDLLDAHEDDQDGRSFVALLGLEGTKKYLNTLSDQICHDFESLNAETDELCELVRYNQTRKI